MPSLPQSNLALGVVFAAMAAAAGLAVAAGPLPDDDTERRCWLQHTAERTRVNFREPTAVEFSNLRDGWRVRSPFLVEFAVRGMGVAPIDRPRPGTGHHHILIDTPLPNSISAPIPFDARHRHFGKGQTSTLLDLPPGRHTLRLLFADHEHRPHYVFSREIAVHVQGPRDTTPAPRIDPRQFEASCQAWYEDETTRPLPATEGVYISNLRAGEPVTSPLNLRFGVIGMGVCAHGTCPEKSGHFVLDVFDAASRRNLQNHVLAKGNTQFNLTLPNGEYLLRLKLHDDQGRPLLPPHELPLRVTGQQAL